MDNNGDRKTTYAIMDLNPDTGEFEVHSRAVATWAAPTLPQWPSNFYKSCYGAALNYLMGDFVCV